MVSYPDDVLFRIEVPNMDNNDYVARFCYSMSRGWLFYEVEDSDWRNIDISQAGQLFSAALKTKYAREIE